MAKAKSKTKPKVNVKVSSDKGSKVALKSASKPASKAPAKALKSLKKVVKKEAKVKAKPAPKVAVKPAPAAKAAKKEAKVKVPEAGAKKAKAIPESKEKELAQKQKEASRSKSKAGDKKSEGKKEEFEDHEFEEEFEVEAVSYGDAIRLTAQDLEDPEELVLTDAEGRKYCKVKDCDQLSVVEGHCRLHYLALWKKIQTRKKILTDGKLEKYIEELTSRYPDKYIEMIKRDLKTEKDFSSAIQELEIEDSADGDFEEDSSFIDEVRGMGRGRAGQEEGGGGGGSEDF